MVNKDDLLMSYMDVLVFNFADVYFLTSTLFPHCLEKRGGKVREKRKKMEKKQMKKEKKRKKKTKKRKLGRTERNETK